MGSDLHFEAGYYKVVKFVDSNVIEVSDFVKANGVAWFIKLKGVDDNWMGSL